MKESRIKKIQNEYREHRIAQLEENKKDLENQLKSINYDLKRLEFLNLS